MFDMSTIVKKRRLPPDLAGLPTIQAEIKYVIAPGKMGPSLEGPVFDRKGNFYVCHTAPNDTHIKKITPDGEISEFCHVKEGMVIGLAFHKDGRCFATDMMRGSLRIFSEDGLLQEEIFIRDRERPVHADCLVFDENGDLLITDLSGTTYNPIGGIFRLRASNGYKTAEKYFGNMASPNGICFSPKKDALWVAESDSNSLIRFQLGADGEILHKQYSPLTVYKNMGKPNVDTFATDAAGYMYLGIMFGGRVIVFDPEGIPAANVLVPGYEDGKLSFTPNVAIHPEKKEAYLLASDGEQAVVLSFPTVSPSQKLYAFE